MARSAAPVVALLVEALPLVALWAVALRVVALPVVAPREVVPDWSAAMGVLPVRIAGDCVLRTVVGVVGSACPGVVLGLPGVPVVA